MINFQYARANDVADAVRQIAADPAAKFIAGGTNLVDLMKDDVERPSRLIDISRLPLKTVEETAGRRLAHRRAGAEHRSRLSPADRAALSAAVERDPGRRLAAIAQHGLDRRQSAAAHALLLFLRHRDALQQARARQRLLRHRRHQPHQRDPRHERGLHRDASLRHVRGARRARGQGPCGGSRRRARRSRSRISIGCPATRRSATPICEPDEIITAIELPAQGFAANYTYLKIRDRLSYAFALVSVAAALELDGGTHQGGAAGARRRRAQAVARSGGRSGAARPGRRRGGLRAARPICCCATPRASSTTPSRSIWRAAPSSAR